MNEDTDSVLRLADHSNKCRAAGMTWPFVTVLGWVIVCQIAADTVQVGLQFYSFFSEVHEGKNDDSRVCVV